MVRFTNLALLLLLTAHCSVATVLKADFAKRFNCPEEQIALSDTNAGPRMKYVEGCNVKQLYVNWTGYAWNHTKELRNKAAFDLDCATDQLQLVPLTAEGTLQVGVRGCQRKATYTYVRTSSSDWGWVADVVSQ